MLKKVSQMGMPPPGPMPQGQAPSDSGPPSSLEDQAIDMVQQKIMKEHPNLIKNIKDIKTIEKSEESSSFVFAVTIQTPTKELIMPVFVVNGIIKPMNLLYDKETDSYIPNSEAWISFSESPLYSSIGEAVKTPKDLKTDVDVRNLVIPPTTGRYSYASDPELVVLTKIAELSKKEKQGLLNFFTKNEDILAKCAEMYGEDAIKIAFSSNPEKSAGKRDNKPFEIITSLDSDIAKKNKFYFNSIVNKGYAIKDRRDPENLNKTIIIQEPEYYFQINQPGVYRVWTTDGIKDVVVGINLSGNTVYADRASSLPPPSVNDYIRAADKTENKSSNAFVSSSSAGARRSNYFILDTDNKLMLVDPGIREVYTAIKVIDPNAQNYSNFKEIFDNIHESNIDKIQASKTPEGLKHNGERHRNRFLFLSVKPNGSITGIEMSVSGIVKTNNTIIINNDFDFDDYTKAIYDPEVSGQDFKVVSNGHEKIIVLPYNVKFFKVEPADYDILSVDNINKNFKAMIESLGGRKVVNINNAGADRPEKLANEIVDIAYQCNIPVKEAELIKSASIENIPIDVFVVTKEISNTLEKFAEALDAADGVEIANFIFSLPYTMHKIGQAMGQAMGQLPQTPPPQQGMLPPGSPMDQGGQGAPPPPDPQAVIDSYINNITDKLKDLNSKATEMKNMLSILSDIKNQSSSQPPANQEEVENLIRDTGDLSGDAMNASMMLGLTSEPDFESNVMSYMPLILKGIDSIGRIIVNINMQSAQIANKFGEKFKNSIEDKANKAFKQLSDFYMFLRGAKITDGGTRS